MSRYLAEPRSILADPLGSAEPRLKNTALNHGYSQVCVLFNKFNKTTEYKVVDWG